MPTQRNSWMLSAKSPRGAYLSATNKQAEHRTDVFRKQDLTATQWMRYDFKRNVPTLAFPRNGIVGENKCY